jgi:hypothetical protein
MNTVFGCYSSSNILTTLCCVMTKKTDSIWLEERGTLATNLYFFISRTKFLWNF